MRNTFSNPPIGKREAVRVAATIVVGFLLCFGCIVSNLYLMDREMYRRYMMEEPLTMVKHIDRCCPEHIQTQFHSFFFQIRIRQSHLPGNGAVNFRLAVC